VFDAHGTNYNTCRIIMPRIILTGGPGAGKTTLLAELASMGYEESARAIIAERLGMNAHQQRAKRANRHQ
jgi:predicted ATPase